MKLGWDLFGYRRADVGAAIESFEKQRADQVREIEALREQVSQLMQAQEVDRMTIASLRRMISELTRPGVVPVAPLTLVIGPVGHLSNVVDLVDALQELEFFQVRFQVFRDGFYRMDGYVEQVGGLMEWLELRDDVRDVRREQETLYVALVGPNL